MAYRTIALLYYCRYRSVQKNRSPKQKIGLRKSGLVSLVTGCAFGSSWQSIRLRMCATRMHACS